MKKTILYITITILLIFIASGSTYMIMKNNERKDNVVDNTTNNTQKEENVTLKDEELKMYLGYIPCFNMEGGAYSVAKSTINKIDKHSLLLTALGLLYDGCNLPNNLCNTNNFESSSIPGYEYISNDKINSILNTMYDIELSDIDLVEDKDKVIGASKGTCFIHNDNGFYAYGCAGYGVIEHIIEDYKVSDDELVIQGFSVMFLHGYISDFYNKKVINLDEEDDNFKNIEGYDNISKYIRNYVKEHKKEFTKYKHTFKKNETGYYWYSTEVV